MTTSLPRLDSPEGSLLLLLLDYTEGIGLKPVTNNDEHYQGFIVTEHSFDEIPESEKRESRTADEKGVQILADFFKDEYDQSRCLLFSRGWGVVTWVAEEC